METGSGHPQTSRKKIWIDLDNSPHVPFFIPIIKALEQRGYPIFITARDCFQVCGLADLYGMKYTRLGRHYGRNKFLKVAGTIYRSLQLLQPALRAKPILALSHGSRSQLMASKMLRVRSICIADYEHTKSLMGIRPDVVVVPEVVGNGIHKKSRSVLKVYPGIKEDVYLPEFEPQDTIVNDLGLNGKKIRVTVRPPASEAHYHNSESDLLFAEVMDFLCSSENVQMVVLPRNEKKQGDMIRARWGKWIDEGKIIIPDHVTNGLNLMWHSDLVVSGGGTMNREAAALGVPVYSIFRGKIGAVDRYLSNAGRLTLLDSAEDVRTKIRLVKRSRIKQPDHNNKNTLLWIVEVIEEVMKMKK